MKFDSRRQWSKASTVPIINLSIAMLFVADCAVMVMVSLDDFSLV